MVQVARGVAMHFHAVWRGRNECARLHRMILGCGEALLVVARLMAVAVAVCVWECEIKKVISRVLHVVRRVQRRLLL